MNNKFPSRGHKTLSAFTCTKRLNIQLFPSSNKRILRPVAKRRVSSTAAAAGLAVVTTTQLRCLLGSRAASWLDCPSTAAYDHGVDALGLVFRNSLPTGTIILPVVLLLLSGPAVTPQTNSIAQFTDVAEESGLTMRTQKIYH
jgi:hypothetical protein